MYTWEEENGALYLYAWRGLTEAFVRQVKIIRRGEDMVLDEVLSGQMREVQDFSVRPGGSDAEMVQAGFHCAVLAPIMAQGKMVGLLALGAYRAQRIEPETIDLIEVIANEIGIGITKARLFEDVERKNELLRLMIEESHHRIKNNLQMISGLLQLELALSDGKAAERLQHAVSQIQAIAQVHNLLSEKMPDQVDILVLIKEIVQTLVASMPAGNEAPDVTLELVHLWLEAEQAVALALIVNELVANSLLHAKPPQGGMLRLLVRCRLEDSTVSLTVTDNGGGFPKAVRNGDSKGQGMRIIRQLAQVNLRGELRLADLDGGAHAILEFPVII
jgi:two-component sensor histidine kinase